MKKLLIESKEQWKALKKRYTNDSIYRSKHSTILQEGQKSPLQYPCIAVSSLDIAMTEADTISFAFVYLTDFDKK